MTRYFMRDTPLCQMEQQMMTPPYFKPRGHGRYYANQRMKRMGLSAAEHGFVSWNGTELNFEYSQPEMQPTMSM